MSGGGEETTGHRTRDACTWPTVFLPSSNHVIKCRHDKPLSETKILLIRLGPASSPLTSPLSLTSIAQHVAIGSSSAQGPDALTSRVLVVGMTAPLLNVLIDCVLFVLACRLLPLLWPPLSGLPLISTPSLLSHTPSSVALLPCFRPVL